MDAGVVGCWAWLLLGLATDRCGARNAFTAAIHVTAVRTRLWSIVNCSVAAFWLRWLACLLLLVSCTLVNRATRVFPTVPCPSIVVLACRSALGSWSELDARGVVPRRARADPRNLARAVPLWTGPVHDDRWRLRNDASLGQPRPNQSSSRQKCPLAKPLIVVGPPSEPQGSPVCSKHVS